MHTCTSLHLRTEHESFNLHADLKLPSECDKFCLLGSSYVLALERCIYLFPAVFYILAHGLYLCCA